MSKIPSELRYTKDHEWIKVLDDGTALIGITDYAQDSLGDITFVEFPEAGSNFDSGDTFGVVESVKAASDLFMPLSGEILEINDEVDSEPELVNSDPYEKGWLLKVKLSDPSEAGDLLSAEDYAKIV